MMESDQVRFNSPSEDTLPSEEPLGLKHPLLSPPPLGRSGLSLQFLVPLGVRSLAVLDPNLFQTHDFEPDYLDASFRDSPFFRSSSSTPAPSTQAGKTPTQRSPLSEIVPTSSEAVPQPPRSPSDESTHSLSEQPSSLQRSPIAEISPNYSEQPNAREQAEFVPKLIQKQVNTEATAASDARSNESTVSSHHTTDLDQASPTAAGVPSDPRLTPPTDVSPVQALALESAIADIVPESMELSQHRSITPSSSLQTTTASPDLVAQPSELTPSKSPNSHLDKLDESITELTTSTELLNSKETGSSAQQSIIVTPSTSYQSHQSTAELSSALSEIVPDAVEPEPVEEKQCSSSSGPSESSVLQTYQESQTDEVTDFNLVAPPEASNSAVVSQVAEREPSIETATLPAATSPPIGQPLEPRTTIASSQAPSAAQPSAPQPVASVPEPDLASDSAPSFDRSSTFQPLEPTDVQSPASPISAGSADTAPSTLERLPAPLHPDITASTTAPAPTEPGSGIPPVPGSEPTVARVLADSSVKPTIEQAAEKSTSITAAPGSTIDPASPFPPHTPHSTFLTNNSGVPPSSPKPASPPKRTIHPFVFKATQFIAKAAGFFLQDEEDNFALSSTSDKRTASSTEIAQAQGLHSSDDSHPAHSPVTASVEGITVPYSHPAQTPDPEPYPIEDASPSNSGEISSLDRSIVQAEVTHHAAPNSDASTSRLELSHDQPTINRNQDPTITVRASPSSVIPTVASQSEVSPQPTAIAHGSETPPESSIGPAVSPQQPVTNADIALPSASLPVQSLDEKQPDLFIATAAEAGSIPAAAETQTTAAFSPVDVTFFQAIAATDRADSVDLSSPIVAAQLPTDVDRSPPTEMDPDTGTGVADGVSAAAINAPPAIIDPAPDQPPVNPIRSSKHPLDPNQSMEGRSDRAIVEAITTPAAPFAPLQASSLTRSTPESLEAVPDHSVENITTKAETLISASALTVEPQLDTPLVETDRLVQASVPTAASTAVSAAERNLNQAQSEPIQPLAPNQAVTQSELQSDSDQTTLAIHAAPLQLPSITPDVLTTPTWQLSSTAPEIEPNPTEPPLLQQSVSFIPADDGDDPPIASIAQSGVERSSAQSLNQSSNSQDRILAPLAEQPLPQSIPHSIDQSNLHQSAPLVAAVTDQNSPSSISTNADEIKPLSPEDLSASPAGQIDDKTVQLLPQQPSGQLFSQPSDESIKPIYRASGLDVAIDKKNSVEPRDSQSITQFTNRSSTIQPESVIQQVAQQSIDPPDAIQQQVDRPLERPINSYLSSVGSVEDFLPSPLAIEAEPPPGFDSGEPTVCTSSARSDLSVTATQSPKTQGTQSSPDFPPDDIKDLATTPSALPQVLQSLTVLQDLIHPQSLHAPSATSGPSSSTHSTPTLIINTPRIPKPPQTDPASTASIPSTPRSQALPASILTQTQTAKQRSSHTPSPWNLAIPRPTPTPPAPIQPKAAHNSEVIQMARSQNYPSAMEEPAEATDAEKSEYLETLAQAIYLKLRQRLRVEQERYGRDYLGRLPW